jgi:hypothetical protein
MYYLIKNDVKLVDFGKLANEQTNLLCTHIENHIEAYSIQNINKLRLSLVFFFFILTSDF